MNWDKFGSVLGLTGSIICLIAGLILAINSINLNDLFLGYGFISAGAFLLSLNLVILVQPISLKVSN